MFHFNMLNIKVVIEVQLDYLNSCLALYYLTPGDFNQSTPLVFKLSP